jgi:sortase A
VEQQTTEQPSAPQLTPEPEPTQAQSGDNTVKPSTIHIRGRSYPLKWNIEETTLKKYIGWMNTSAKPGEIGVCVVMGHRNHHLRCLKDVERGDVITIVDADGAAHSYTVESGEIVTDNNITFGATEQRKLVLITCYPFYYSGSAPHQYVVQPWRDGRILIFLIELEKFKSLPLSQIEYMLRNRREIAINITR